MTHPPRGHGSMSHRNPSQQRPSFRSGAPVAPRYGTPAQTSLLDISILDYSQDGKTLG